ncbi:MAG: hypothetical protein JW932_03975 [Deltaproteobacteria bacterium]|nr:hypothetical protein [Deltaproteobacteria bacterium]
MSGLYLRLGPMLLSSSRLALAEEDVVDEAGALELKEQMLRKKEMEIKEKEEQLNKREKNLIPLQTEIDAKLEELNALQVTLTAYARKLSEREKLLNDAKMDHLVALYSAMEPARAAIIMAQLHMDTVVRILSNMKGKSAGLILAAMEPSKGAMISEKLSQLDY